MDLYKWIFLSDFMCVCIQVYTHIIVSVFNFSEFLIIIEKVHREIRY